MHDKKEWLEQSTKVYTCRFMYSTGIPQALEHAQQVTGEAPVQYIKKALVQRLCNEGLIESSDVILNLTQHKSQERKKRLYEQLKKEFEEG